MSTLTSRLPQALRLFLSSLNTLFSEAEISLIHVQAAFPETIPPPTTLRAAAVAFSSTSALQNADTYQYALASQRYGPLVPARDKTASALIGRLQPSTERSKYDGL